ncbi:MAG: DNA polymerase I [Candidatus Magasanikbacteria bacterium CG10_big_fil_rev_8_21_14_0_10_42_10]|uniref:DNA polymerase I n=2 Tax=Candidatus Magasanikiibacteriota TaxID=1752731 RepID=A0A2H0TX24_9BACT|nr:MAG: DNA polymerase I [Candidatus Magasanikbacteria bacterium CG10_big_fil_rev_8_21_14_0_10_42_10]PIZ92625.1 MAG: DNA polymerase I [Candidatus Magasanikbacteria bacterium CG_4_10_14_0_2_um_filter_41_10]
MKTSQKNETCVIIDGHAVIHRAYHALPPMSTKDGSSVNAVYGFALMLLKTIQDLNPTYIAVSFDVAGGTFRDELYTEYKATRVKADDDLYAQIPLVYEMVEAFGIPIYTKEGFEADDVIGTIAEKNKKEKNLTTIIVTGDKDLLQLVDDDVTEVYLLKKGMSDFELYNEAHVLEKFGFGPQRIVDYKALRGDASDNIPGVKGIGEKTATTLITEIGGIDTIYKEIKKSDNTHIQDVMSASMFKKLEEGEESARMSFELATIRRDVPEVPFALKEAHTHEFDRDALVAVFRKFEFFSLVKRIPGMEEESTEIKKQENKKSSRKKIVVIDSKTLPEFVKDMETEILFACKAVLSHDDVLTATLDGFVFVCPRVHAFVDFKKLSVKEQKQVLEVFQNDEVTIIGHDLKQLVKVLRVKLSTCKLANLFDIMIASYLLNSSTRAHDVQQIVLRELGEEMTTSDSQGSLFGVDPQVVADELDAIFRVAEKYKTAFSKEDATVFSTIEMPLIPVLADMELAGVAIDADMLGRLSKDAHSAIKKLETKIYKEAGKEFNVSSSVQLRDILFETLELPTDMIKKGKTGYSTAASELEKLREYHDIIPLIEEYREVEKLRNTYIDVLPTLLNKKTGRIHTSFNQAVAATGRLSSSDPNLQNIPIRTDLGKEVRNAFISADGYSLVAADYSQIELRIVAHLAKDKTLIDIFKRGEDVHTATAAAIQGVPVKDVTKEMRSKAKAVNFGVLYGMGAFGLASRTGITQAEAKIFIDTYFERFAGVAVYLEEILAQAKKDGYVETLFGRRRYIPELSSSNYQVRNSGERMAINMPVQGTAADMMKLAMISVHKALTSQQDDVRMLLQVHDELVLEVKKGKEEKIGELLQKEMAAVLKLDVPVVVDVHSGKRWGELK